MSLILSLFPNIGMLDVAFEEEWPEVCIVRGPDPLFNALSDVRRFSPPSGRFDGVIGGPPCQSFSSLSHLVRRNGNEPRFGNLIPEFERCIVEARPEWFLMENVWQAPLPIVGGYGVTAFLLENATLDSGDGLGLEQMRARRFSFGMRGRAAPDLRRWIRLAALKLPKVSPTVTQCAVNNSPEAHGRVLKSAVIGHGGATPQQRRPQRFLKHAVVGHLNAGLGRLAASTQRICKNAVVSGHGKSLEPTASGGVVSRYAIPEMCRLQGLPENFLDDTPWLADAKRDVIAAGVPLFMGRAIARAVRCALDLPSEAFA